MLLIIYQNQMFSMYRSQKNIENKATDFKSMYLQEKKLKQQFQRRAQLAELKYRKLAQSINKKCIRCMNIDEKKTKQDKIMQLKDFKNGLNLLNMGSVAHIPRNERIGRSKIIENFGVFGIPQSMLIEPEHFDQLIQGELIYASAMPSITEQHAAKLAFPSGIVPKYYSGNQAKDKAIEIMSCSYSLAKIFIMSFQGNKDEEELNCQVKRLMNPENRLFAVCISIQDFTLVPNWQTNHIESQKVVNNQIMDKANIESQKALSCLDTDVSNQKDCSIATSPRVYCIFSYYPFFDFYQQMLKAIVNSVKTERLVIYRESGASLAEADSHFFLQRLKETYKQISHQIEAWQIKIAKQFQLKLLNCQKIPLSLNPQLCLHNFIQDWGLPIFNMFNVDSFIDLFTLVMLEERIIFVSDNPTILTLTVHLFSQLLPRPFKYPYPIINILPENQGYFETMCPFIFGILNSKKILIENKIAEAYPNKVFVFLQKQGVQIISFQSKKSILKKRPKLLRDSLSTKFKSTSDRGRRISNLQLVDQITFKKDKLGICSEIIKQVNLYLNQEVMKHLPKNYEIDALSQKISKTLKSGEDLNQVLFKQIKKQSEGKSKDEFFRSLIDTQLVSTYLFK